MIEEKSDKKNSPEQIKEPRIQQTVAEIFRNLGIIMSKISEIQRIAENFVLNLPKTNLKSTHRVVTSPQMLDFFKQVSQLFSECHEEEKKSFKEPIIRFEKILIQGRDLIIPGVILPNMVWSDVIHSNPIIFEKTRFLGDVLIQTLSGLHGTHGNPLLSFQEVEFESNANLIMIEKPLVFKDVQFKGPVVLQSAHEDTPLYLNIDRTTFWKSVSIQGRIQSFTILDSKFKESLNINSQFKTPTNWGGKAKTEFLGTVLFGERSSFADADFSGINWRKGVSFKGTTFSGITEFQKSHFRAVCNFNNTTFLDSTSFAESTFERAPTFHEAKLHRDTSFTNIEFEECNTEEDWRAFRRLREIMGEFKADVETADFFMHEQRTFANLELKENPWSLVGRLSKIYDGISNYGQNILMPFVYLFALNLWVSFIFELAYIQEKISLNLTATTLKWSHSIPPWIGLTLQNLFHPFSQFKPDMPYTSKTGWVFFASIFQTLASALFITLGFLAIRRKFKKESE